MNDKHLQAIEKLQNSFDHFKQHVDQKFEQFDERAERQKQFDQIMFTMLEKLDTKMDDIQKGNIKRFEKLDQRFEKVEEKLDKVYDSRKEIIVRMENSFIFKNLLINSAFVVFAIILINVTLAKAGGS